MWLYFLKIICALLCLTAAKIRTMPKCGLLGDYEARIIGGETTTHGHHPWMVTIHKYFDDLEHICGGSILNENWIVTAAHCILPGSKAEDYELFVGIHNLSDVNFLPGLKVSRIRVHERYNPFTFLHDIALMRLASPIDLKWHRGYVNGICLPENDTDPTGTAIVTGWGHEQENGTESDVLKEVEVPIVPRKECNPRKRMPWTTICAGMRDKDSCQSDSGGPLVQRNAKGRFTLIGIVSYGYGCGRSGFPGVYTKVGAYRYWLDMYMD